MADTSELEQLKARLRVAVGMLRSRARDAETAGRQADQDFDVQADQNARGRAVGYRQAVRLIEAALHEDVDG
jgi:hypothetical protein